MSVEGASRRLPESVVEIVPDTLFAVGWSEATDGRISWAHDRKGRWLPLQCYVLRSEAHALIIDTSVTAHRARIERGLDYLLGGTHQRDVLLTRYNFETLSNLPWLSRRYNIDRIFPARASSLALTSQHVMGFVEAFEEENIRAHVVAGAGLTPTAMPEATSLAVGALELNVLTPAMRLQSTHWVYESRTRTLFCADAWGFATRDAEGPTTFAIEADGEIDSDHISGYLRNKFDWLPGANTVALRKTLQTIMRDFSIDRLCPNLGCVIEGPDVSNRVLELTLLILAEFGEEGYKRQLERQH